MDSGYQYDVTKTATELKAAKEDCRLIAEARDDREITLLQLLSLLFVHIAVSIFMRSFKGQIAPEQ